MSVMRYLFILVCFFTASQLLAQATPPLDRLISVDIRNEKVENALRQISNVGRFEFSYSATILEGNALVTIRLTNVPVRDVLNRIFQSRITFKSRGNHVILLWAELPEAAPKNFLLDGYILDEQTGERIAQASIFEKTTLASTVSNPFGYYRLRLPTNLPTVRLDVRKRDYLGETVIIRSKLPHPLNIRMTPQPLNTSAVQALPPIRVTEDTLQSMGGLAMVAVEMPVLPADSTPQPRPISMLDKGREGITRLFVSAQQAIHDVNLNRDTLYRDWQVSFLPFIGTNLRLSGRISNGMSINVLAGYSFSVRIFEVGGLMNLVRTDVNGLQWGGLANVVGGRIDGLQVAGLVNVVGGPVNGFQLGGWANVVGGPVNGFQLGGLSNAVLGDMQGFQAGGLLNVALRSVKGVQLAGLVNYAQHDVKGWQISGILNRAKHVSGGHQIGLVNIADSAGNVPIGLISYVKKGGFQRFEIDFNEVNLLNVTVRTGVRRFYNILTAGYSFEREGSPRMSAGYGLGTAFVLSPKTLFTLEGTYHHLFTFNKTIDEEWNSQIRLSPLIETRLSKHIALAFGPSVNWYFSSDGTNRPLLQPEIPLFSDRTDAFSNNRHWGWIGFQVGLRYGNL